MALEAVPFVYLINALPATKNSPMCSESGKMSRLVAYINNDKSQQSVKEKLDDYKAEFGYKLFPEEIMVCSIDERYRVGKLADVEYYIYSEKLKIGVLSNGVMFNGEFVAERFQDYTHAFDPCRVWK